MTIIDRRQIVLTMSAVLLPFLGGCWRHSEITVQEEGRSFLRLKGNLEGVALRLDGGQPMKLLSDDGKVAEDGTLWEVLPGRHLVELVRAGQSILRRDIFVGPGQALDVAVPR